MKTYTKIKKVNCKYCDKEITVTSIFPDEEYCSSECKYKNKVACP